MESESALESFSARYNRRSFTAALGLPPASASASTSTNTPTPLAITQIQADSWQSLFAGLPSERRLELLIVAWQLITDTRCTGFNKSRALREVESGIENPGQLPTSATAKFFIMKAALGDKFVFQYGSWIYPAGVDAGGTCTVLRDDGSIGIERIGPNGFVTTDNPWTPVRGRSAYKKPELVSMMQQLGAPVNRAKADVLHAQLLGLVKPLPQAN